MVSRHRLPMPVRGRCAPRVSQPLRARGAAERRPARAI